MTKETKWRRLFESKGWINNDIIRCGDEGKLKITIAGCGSSPEHHSVTIESAMIMPDLDILCFEDKSGTVFFHWEDIIMVKLEPSSKRKGWL